MSSASAKRPLAASQRGDSGHPRRMKTATIAGMPPMRNRLCQPKRGTIQAATEATITRPTWKTIS